MDNDKAKRALLSTMSLPHLLATTPYSNAPGPKTTYCKHQTKIRFETCPACGATNKTLYHIPSYNTYVCLKCYNKLVKQAQPVLKPAIQNSIGAALTDEQRTKLSEIVTKLK